MLMSARKLIEEASRFLDFDSEGAERAVSISAGVWDLESEVDGQIEQRLTADRDLAVRQLSEKRAECSQLRTELNAREQEAFQLQHRLEVAQREIANARGAGDSLAAAVKRDADRRRCPVIVGGVRCLLERDDHKNHRFSLEQEEAVILRCEGCGKPSPKGNALCGACAFNALANGESEKVFPVCASCNRACDDGGVKEGDRLLCLSCGGERPEEDADDGYRSGDDSPESIDARRDAEDGHRNALEIAGVLK